MSNVKTYIWSTVGNYETLIEVDIDNNRVYVVEELIGTWALEVWEGDLEKGRKFYKKCRKIYGEPEVLDNVLIRDRSLVNNWDICDTYSGIVE